MTTMTRRALGALALVALSAGAASAQDKVVMREALTSLGAPVPRFRVVETVSDVVQERGFRLPERYLEFEPQVRALEAAMRVRRESTPKYGGSRWATRS